VVVVPVALGIALPYMGPALGIIGGLCMTCLGVVIPIPMYLIYFQGQLPLWKVAILGLVVVVSTIMGAWATYYSAASMADKFEGAHTHITRL